MELGSTINHNGLREVLVRLRDLSLEVMEDNGMDGDKDAAADNERDHSIFNRALEQLSGLSSFSVGYHYLPELLRKNLTELDMNVFIEWLEINNQRTRREIERLTVTVKKQEVLIASFNNK